MTPEQLAQDNTTSQLDERIAELRESGKEVKTIQPWNKLNKAKAICLTLEQAEKKEPESAEKTGNPQNPEPVKQESKETADADEKLRAAREAVKAHLNDIGKKASAHTSHVRLRRFAKHLTRLSKRVFRD